MLTPTETSPEAEIFDAAAIAAELARLSEVHSGNERELRSEVAQQLQARRWRDGRAAAEALLIEDRHGRRCAERLCAHAGRDHPRSLRVRDQASLPGAEAVRSRAHGGRRHRRLRPRPAGARAPTSISCSCCPTNRPPGAKSVAEAILYCLWDMGLKVGHATRSVNECIRQAKADMTIRTAILEARFLLGDRKLYDELVARFDKEVVQGTAARIRRRQARRARGTASPRRPVALSGRAQRQGRQGRAARPAHAVLDRQICLSRARAARS